VVVNVTVAKGTDDGDGSGGDSAISGAHVAKWMKGTENKRRGEKGESETS
jgi:hypothetical protein